MWRDDAYLLDMLIYARKARSFSAGAAWQKFAADEVLQAATLHVLQVIGEAAGKVSEHTREAHPEIPWQQIVGLRHRLVHDYPRVELPRIREIVENHVPPLIEALEKIVPPEED